MINKHSMKKSSYLVFSSFILTVLFFNFCSKEKWKGRIYNEGDVLITETEGSGMWGEKISEKITLKENLSIGVEEGQKHQMFHSTLDVTVDSELNIYVLDIKNYRLLKFDKLGNFIWEAGRKGQGPGEFRDPREVNISPSLDIYVLDSFFHFQVFDIQGKYQQTINLEKWCRNIDFLPDGTLLVVRSTLGQMGFMADYLSIEEELYEEFPVEYRHGQKLPEWAGGGIGGGFQFISGKIYMILPDKYEIREYTLEGKLLRIFRRDFELKPTEVRMVDEHKGLMIGWDIMGPCFLYRKKMLLNMLQRVERKDENKSEITRFLDFFNEKGQFLGSYKMPEATTLNAIDDENYLYFVQQEPYPRVIRFEMEIE
jgi:hypothetical protein